jgi:LacI family transcriptional regulator
MPETPRRVAFMLELEFPYKRHAGIFAGAQQYAEEQGWDSTIDEFVAERLPVRRTKSLPYDGVIARASTELAERADHLGLPVVNTWIGSPAREQLPGVFLDCTAIGHMNAQHLLARGLRRFAVLGSGDYGSQLEVTAFEATVREAGFPCITANVPLSAIKNYASWQKTEQRIDASMQQWQLPIGVCSVHEDTGRLVAQMCRHRGWRVPFDVAIVAGQNEETLCERPSPSLTSVEFGFERVGYQAAKLLDRLMDEKQKGKRGKRKKENEAPEHILLPPQGLVVRESTDFFAVDDPEVAAALQFIAANSQRPISADDVARGAQIGLRTLQDKFSEHLGRPISDEIRRVRIERAKRELAQGKRPLNEIARDVGFGPAMQMYKVFVRELGVTPSAYRKERQVEQEE